MSTDRRTATVTAADGTRLAYHRFGHGPTVVCMPGGPGRASVYLEDLGGSAADLELVALDARGTGGSAHPDDPATLGFPHLADDLEDLRVALGLDRMVLLGHSAGALVAQVYAARHPDRLAGLVLVTPPGRLHDDSRADLASVRELRRDAPWYADSVATLAAPPDGTPEDERRRTLAFRPFMYAGWDARRQAHAAGADTEQDAAAEAGFGSDAGLDLDPARFRVRLAALDCPVLVVGGELDAVTGPAAARSVAAGFPTGRLVVLADCGHFPWVDRPAEFRRTLVDFVTRC